MVCKPKYSITALGLRAAPDCCTGQSKGRYHVSPRSVTVFVAEKLHKSKNAISKKFSTHSGSKAKQKHTQHSPSFLYTLLYRSREVGRKNNLKRYMAGCSQFINVIKGWRVEVVFFYLLWEIFILVIEKNFLKFDAEGLELSKILTSLEQFIQTVKGQNNFW